MPKITFKFLESSPVEVIATSGSTLMEVAVCEDIPGIDGDCGGACACGTCHVIVDDSWRETVGDPDDYERDMLDVLDEKTPASRLACQIAVSDNLDGLIVTVVPAQDV